MNTKSTITEAGIKPVTTQEETKLQKVYRFKYLSEEAKRIAAHQVHQDDEYDYHDWDIYEEDLKKEAKEILNEAGLFAGEVFWSSDYSLSIDLSSTVMRTDYLQKVLSEEDFTLFNRIKHVSDNNTLGHLFDSDYNEKGFTIEFDYIELNESHAIQFLMDYSLDEELKDRYKLPYLFMRDSNFALSTKENEQLGIDLTHLAVHFAERLSKKVSLTLEPIYQKIYDLIESTKDYMGSEEYYFSQLDAECFISEQYLFNKDGDIILKEDEFINAEYEQEYDRTLTEEQAV